MCSADQIKVMFVQEFGNNLCTKCERHTSVIFTPAHCILSNEIKYSYMNKMDWKEKGSGQMNNSIANINQLLAILLI
jgi:hypothetical protein